MNSKYGFGTRHLQKLGWDEGKGLGAKENGIKDAIKVKMKNNKSGLGLDEGAEFTFHWWDHIFNKAANSIKVTSNENGVKIEKDTSNKKIEPMIISNRKPMKRSLNGKPLLYGTFVKSGTYHPDCQNIDETKDVTTEESSEDEDCFSGKDTLEKTFKLTGLTGHKAARHGHQLNGKLKRVQEQELLKNIDAGTSSKNISGDTVSKKRKKRKHSDAEISITSIKKKCMTESSKSENIEIQKKKKKKKKKRKSASESKNGKSSKQKKKKKGV